MKLLYLDCGMGAAGDMLGAALAELLPDAERDVFVAEINNAGIPGTEVSLNPSIKCGITGTHLTVTVDGEEEEMHNHEHGHSHEHEHSGHEHLHEDSRVHSHAHGHEEHCDHGHDHGHGGHTHEHEHTHGHHAHRSLHDIQHIIADLKLPETVRQDILAVYSLIAEAESKAHDKLVSEIHFHEVGTMDAIADIASVCLLLHKLAPDQIVASPVHVGNGQVKCAHGILPVPAPATAYILKDVPIYGGQIQGELCTPTGAALLKHFVTRFGEMPMITPNSTGYGMGKKDFPAANCVRAILSDTFAEEAADAICELACNVDDMTGEDVAFAAEIFLENGALDAFTIPCTMKKGRPGTLITVLCRENDREKMAQLMLRHTTTLGVRIAVKERRILARTESECSIPEEFLRNAAAEDAETGADCTIRYKTSTGCGVTRTKYEHDDLAKISRAHGLTLEQVRALLADLK